jgi:hypothetical protein
MKYVRTPGFLIDLRRLPDEHRKLFVQAVHEILRPALDAGAHKGAVPWPRALRIHRIGANYPMTWSFAGPMAGRSSGWQRSQAKRSWCGYVSVITVSTTPEAARSGSGGWWAARSSW